MFHQVFTRLRGLLKQRGADLPESAAADSLDPQALEQDPEWDELLDWAREAPTPAPLLMAALPPAHPRSPVTVVAPARLNASAGDQAEDDEEWEWQLARAKAHALAATGSPAPPSPPRRLPSPRPRTPASKERPRTAASLSISALAQRLEALATAARAQSPRSVHRATGRS